MRERVSELVGNRAKIMWVSTFHSACVRILRKEIDKFGYKSSFTIYDAADSKRLMTMVCRDLDLDVKRYQPRAILNWISNAKNELLDHEDAAKDARNNQEETYAAAYAEYQRRLRGRQRARLRRPADDDRAPVPGVPGGAGELAPAVPARSRRRVPGHQPRAVRPHPRAVRRRRWRSRPRAGSRRARPTCEPAELMVVGDADQSIYAFRGANIRNIMDFEIDFPNASTILLEQNYRSTQTILTAANAVISRNDGRKPKNLWSEAGDGDADRRLRRRRRARRGPVRRRGDRPADRRGQGARRRRRDLLPHQRAVPGVRGGLHPGRHALPRGRRGPVLRAARGARRAGLPAGAGQPRRRGVAAAHPQHPQARHRRACRGVRGVAVEP